MNFNRHLEIEGKHSFLSPSKYHWLGYDTEKLLSTYQNMLAVQRGNELHAFAAKCIQLGEKLVGSKKTLNMYVNDAISFRMSAEVPLMYSINCFGTADAISFRDGMLRIHDLKTGANLAHIEQLMIYAAIFCLEYNVDPYKIKTELRIYQNNEILYHKPSGEEIKNIMDTIVEFDAIIEQFKNNRKE